MTSDYMTRFLALRDAKDYHGIIDSIPYARLLGVEMSEDGEGNLLFTLPFAERNVGNPILPALHGGVIGGFLENAALIHLMWIRESLGPPKVIDFSLDYLKSGRPQPLFARCSLTKQGKRVAHMLIEAWQEDARQPVAVARAHFLLA